ncbi:hypothetical protein U1Q18_021461 [Sarracenia purpurea var. burkii]
MEKRRLEYASLLTETKRWKVAVEGRVLSPAENQRFGIKGFGGATETKRRKAAASHTVAGTGAP